MKSKLVQLFIQNADIDTLRSILTQVNEDDIASIIAAEMGYCGPAQGAVGSNVPEDPIYRQPTGSEKIYGQWYLGEINNIIRIGGMTPFSEHDIIELVDVICTKVALPLAKIEIIKEIRNRFNFMLKTSKDLVNFVVSNKTPEYWEIRHGVPG